MVIKKYDSWLAREEDIDGDIEQFNDLHIRLLMDDIYCENYEALNELSPSMLDDICNMHSPKLLLETRYDFNNVKKGEMITYNNRTIFQACIDDKQGNAPVSFVCYGNINTDLILNILANFSSKICDDYEGEDLMCIKNSIVDFNQISTILDYYKELFDKLEEYYLNIDSLVDLNRLYENFYLMTEGSLSFHKNFNQDSLKSFKKYIFKQLKFLTECLKHIDKTYEKDYKGHIIHPIY